MRVGFNVLFFGRLLGLVSVVLEPDFNLGRREIETVGKVFTFLGAQILLQLESLLELVNLGLREENAALSFRLVGILRQRTDVERTRVVVVIGRRVVTAAA